MDSSYNFFAVKYGDGIVYIKGFASNVSAYEFFRKASEYISCSDCADVQTLDICWHGQRVHYDGWKPNMHYVFVNCRGKVIWEGYFPEFDH